MEEITSNTKTEEMLFSNGYSEKAIRYLRSTENLGRIENADQETQLTGPCGDSMQIFLRIQDDVIEDVKMEVLGCAGTLVSASALVSLAKGKTLGQARAIDLNALLKELERLPDQKAHCARLAIKILHKSIDQYQRSEGRHTDDKEKGG